MIFELFKEVTDKLRSEKIRFAVAGGIATSLYRLEKRTTEDIDFLIYLGGGEEKKAVEIIEYFGMKAGIARKADIEGGPMFAIKKRNTPPYLVVGRDKNDPERVGLDFLLPNFPWFQKAFERAENNLVDFGSGKVPCMTVEDIIIAKLYSSQNNSKRLKDLDDLQSIFTVKHELELDYLATEMKRLKLKFPKILWDQIPVILKRISRK